MDKYNFTWAEGIKSQEDFTNLIEDLKNDFGTPVLDYKQAASLLYEGTLLDRPNYVLVILQIPAAGMYQDGEIHAPWFEVYEIEDIEDYKAGYDDATDFGIIYDEDEITFDNAEELMLQLAKEYCD